MSFASRLAPLGLATALAGCNQILVPDLGAPAKTPPPNDRPMAGLEVSVNGTPLNPAQTDAEGIIRVSQVLRTEKGNVLPASNNKVTRDDQFTLVNIKIRNPGSQPVALYFQNPLGAVEYAPEGPCKGQFKHVPVFPAAPLMFRLEAGKSYTYEAVTRVGYDGCDAAINGGIEVHFKPVEPHSNRANGTARLYRVRIEDRLVRE